MIKLFKFTVWLSIIISIGIFCFYNHHLIKLDLISYQVYLPTALLFIISLVIGFTVGKASSLLKIIKLKLMIKQLSAAKEANNIIIESDE